MHTISRRRILISGAMAGAAAFARVPEALLAKAAQPRTKVSFKVPGGACDCHVHIFGDPQRYPMVPGRVYTPEPASVAELRSLVDALHMDRLVIVQPSVYGTDNRCTLDAVRALGTRARAIAVVDANTTGAAMDEMARTGVRGIRVNLVQAGVSDPAAALPGLRAAMARAQAHGWHVVINTSLRIIEALQADLQASPVPIVIDHFGGALAAAGVQQPGFDALVNLVKSGKAYIKISAATDLVSTQAPEYADVIPLARALVAANPQRVLWGTDWPHPDTRVLPGRKNTDISPLMQTDDGHVLNLLAVWVPDAAIRHAILVDNPAKLYGF
jgi:predicted TIM-barrel fold metal-dependent hydrolase